MKKLTRIIGSAVLAALLYAVPIMMTCAFCLDWYGLYKLIWFICGMVMYIAFAVAVYENTEVDG